jgi:epoxyqueuosine reductase QueG
MSTRAIELWGAADLTDFATPPDSDGQLLPHAVSWALPMNPRIMAGIQQGPDQAYADEYAQVNARLNEVAGLLAETINGYGFRAYALAASERTDTVNIKGDFPHKTAATRSGLGWIGRHCQLITRKFGSWIRLGTVFTDMALAFGKPIERSL